MTTTLDNITIDQIRALREEAEAAGDHETMVDCDTALALEARAIGPDYFRHFSCTLRLVNAIREAEARNDDLSDGEQDS